MANWFSSNLQTSLGSLKNKVTSTIRDALDTEEIDNEFLNNDDEDPRDRLELAKQKLLGLQEVVRSNEKKIEQLTVVNDDLLNEKKASHKRLDQFKDLLREKESEIEQLSVEKGPGEQNGIEAAGSLASALDGVHLSFQETSDLKGKFLDGEEFSSLVVETLLKLEATLVQLRGKDGEPKDVLDRIRRLEGSKAELQEEKSELETQLNEVNSEKILLENECSEMKEKMETLLNDVSAAKQEELDQQLEALCNDLELSNERVAVLETKLNETLEAKQESEAQLNEIRSEKVLLENECSELKEKMETLLKDLSGLKEDQQHAQAGDALRDKHISELESMKKEVDALRVRLHKQQGELDGKTETCTSLEQTLERVTDELNTAKLNCENLEESIKQHILEAEQAQRKSEEAMEAKQELNKIRSEKVLLENECSELKEKMEILLKDLSGLKDDQQLVQAGDALDVSKLESMRNEMEALHIRLHEQQEELDGKAETCTDLKKALQRATDELNASKLNCENFKENVEQHILDAEQAQQESKEAMEAKQELDALLNEIRSDKVLLENECSELKEEMETLLKELSRLKEDQHHAHAGDALHVSELESMKNEVEALHARLHQQQEELDGKAETCTDLEETVERVTDELNTAKLNCENFEESVKRHISDAEQAQRESEEAVGARDVIAKELEEAMSELTESQEKCKELLAEVRDHKESEADLRREMEPLKVEGSENISGGLESKFIDDAKSLEDVKEENKVLQRQIGELKCLESELEQIKLSHGELEVECSRMKVELERSREHLKELTASDDDLEKEEIGSVEAEKLDEFIRENTQLKAELAEHRVANNKLNEQLSKLIEVTADDSSKLEELSEEVEELKRSEAEYVAQVEEMKAQEVETLASTELYKTQYERLLQEYNQYLEDLEKMQDKVEELQAEKRTLEAQFNLVDTAANRLREEGEELKQQLEQSEKKVQHLEAMGSKFNECEQQLVWEKQKRKQLEEQAAAKDGQGETVEQLQEEVAKLKSEKEKWQQGDFERQQMVDVLNEKTRENSKLKRDNGQLLDELSSSASARQTKIEEMSKAFEEKEYLSKSTVKQLSELIRDKDLEIDALKAKGESLLEIANASEEKSQCSEAKVSDLELALRKVKCGSKEEKGASDEITSLKEEVSELERKLNLARVKNEMILESRNLENKRTRFLSEPQDCSVDEGKVKRLQEFLQAKEDQMLQMTKDFKSKEEELLRGQEAPRSLKMKAESLEMHLEESQNSVEYLKAELERCQEQLKVLTAEKEEVQVANDLLRLLAEEKEHDLAMAQRNLEQLTAMVEENSSKSETQQLERSQNVAAIQDLRKTNAKLVRERDDAKLQAADKEREMTGFRKEVNSVIDKKKRLEHELERLKKHLLAVEETYTQEALENEARESGLKSKLAACEEDLRAATAEQSSSSKATAAHVHGLEAKVVELSRECEQAKMKLFNVESDYSAHQRAMNNLNMALEGFQLEKENDLKKAQASYEERLQGETAKQAGLGQDIQALQQQLEKANEGLKAANRLGDQLEQKNMVISGLRKDVKVREDLLKKAQAELDQVSNSTTGKVDRYLVKNLVVGYAVADDEKKPEVMKIIATVLDFNQEERDKIGMGQGGWFRGWFGGGGAGTPGKTGGRSSTPSVVQAATGLDQGLAQAFVQFLETESKPKKAMQLPVNELPSPSGTNSSTSSTPTQHLGGEQQQPVAVVNNPILNTSLPAFAVNRSSSAILKNVLHEEQRNTIEEEPPSS